MTRAFARTVPTYDQGAASVPLRALTAALIALFALDNIVLLGLLSVAPALVAAAALTLPSLLAILAWKAMPAAPRIGAQTLLVCFMLAALLLIVGGEGRLFYAPVDWQIRDAVLADMGNHRWPFDYWLDGKAQMLRAPVGMYLLPALLGGASQLGRDWALLAHNALILGLLFAQGAALFEGRRARIIALIIFVMFSGLDVIGVALAQLATGSANWNHLERWASNYQYSAHITQLFWAPQHGLAGWAIALFYMLWRRNLAPIGLFAASLPLLALWSPLILFGALPFAAFAGVRALLSGAWDRRDVLLCALATALAIPALAYLSTDAASVGGGLHPPTLLGYGLILLLEVLPFLLPLLADRSGATDRATILIAGLCLIVMPLWTMGASNDFQMRASIMPLALVALAFANFAIRLQAGRDKVVIIALIALGSVTGIVEISHAVRFSASPAPLCSLPGVWHQQAITDIPHASYFAARAAFPIPITPADRVSAVMPPQCWARPWDSLAVRP
ncbi:hypothetical protein [Sphingobium sp.]|uniref:hypothetical protein n=1 Tax=Sphingobium sp. TaxID=1912891 RepID=UPI003BB572A8